MLSCCPGIGRRLKRKTKAILGKKACMRKTDSWKGEQHVCMHGRPNDSRVRVLVMYCNG
jgi:hypothetical protein